jgi:hypothetical protein
MSLVRTELFEEIRARLKRDGKREDIVVLLAWLLSNFLDDGQIRSPSGARRKTIVLDGMAYWLVRCLK